MAQLVLGLVVGAVVAAWGEVVVLLAIRARVALVQRAERTPVLWRMTYRGCGLEAEDAARAGVVIVS